MKFAESEIDGEPSNQVPEESFKSEEGCHEIFNILPISSKFSVYGLIIQENSRKYGKISIKVNVFDRFVVK